MGWVHLMTRDYRHIISQQLLKAAVTNYAYDPQCEQSRSRYLIKLINLSPQKKILIGQVLQKLLQQDVAASLHF